MSASIEAYTTDVCAMVTRLGDAATDEVAPVIAARLGRRLLEARKAASDADELMKQIVAHQQAATDATNALAAADAELEVLHRIAGVTDNPALEQAIERSRQRDAAVRTIARAEAALLTQGDGLPEAALLAEATGIDPDAVVGRLAEIETELATLGERREALSAQRTLAEALLTELAKATMRRRWRNRPRMPWRRRGMPPNAIPGCTLPGCCCDRASTGFARNSRGRCCGPRGGISPADRRPLRAADGGL